MMKSVFAEDIADSLRHLRKLFHVSVLYTNSAITREYATAMLDASVGVNQPSTKPERMISGVMRARMEPANWCIKALKLNG
jgi:hypothetical protein